MSAGSQITSRMAPVNGAQLYYEVKGDGHPLLLLHAGVADSRMWDKQFAAFSRVCRVVRFDLRGFGRSTIPPGSFSNVEDVRALLDFLKIKRTFLLGISFGGLIALDFTLAYPHYVRALVLGAPSVSGATPSQRIRQFWEEEERALEKGDIEGATELNLRLWVDGPRRRAEQVDADVREAVREMQSAIFRKEIPDEVEEIGPNSGAIERLGQVAIPVQVMVGELDLEEKLALADRLAAEMPDCRKVVLAGAAHMLNMEKAEAFNRSVLDFLEGI